LINPGSTAVCDCGWSFVDKTMTEPRDFSAHREDERRDHRSGGGAQIAIGALFLVAGIIITAVTYGGASARGGGTYIVAYGPIAFGIVSIIRGLMSLMSR
jgi:hypothetical protein